MLISEMRLFKTLPKTRPSNGYFTCIYTYILLRKFCAYKQTKTEILVLAMRANTVCHHNKIGKHEKLTNTISLDSSLVVQGYPSYPYLSLARSHHVDIIADNVPVYDQGVKAHGDHQIWFPKSLSGSDVPFPFYLNAVNASHCWL